MKKKATNKIKRNKLGLSVQLTTISVPYTCSDDSFIPFLESLRSEYSRSYRTAYKFASYGLDEVQIRKDTYNRFQSSNTLMDTNMIESCCKQAIGQFKADFEISKSNDKFKLGKRIFGGKKNFERRSKNLITKDEFQKNRLEKFYMIGHSLSSGNRKFEFTSTESIKFKPKKGTSFNLQLNNLSSKFGRTLSKAFEKANNKDIPITILLDENKIYFQFDENLLFAKQTEPFIKGRVMGIDLNPNYIGISVLNGEDQMLLGNLFDNKFLTGKASNADKLKHEVRQLAHHIGRLAKFYRCQFIFVEELNFESGDRNKGTYYNRLVHNQFLYNEFKRILAKSGVQVVEVNAAYSSTIGNLLHSHHTDAIASSLEIARRGKYHRVIKGGGVYFPSVPDAHFLSNLWKKEIEFSVCADLSAKGWIGIHNHLKSTGYSYRVPVPSDTGMFREFQSYKSNIRIFNTSDAANDKTNLRFRNVMQCG